MAGIAAAAAIGATGAPSTSTHTELLSPFFTPTPSLATGAPGTTPATSTTTTTTTTTPSPPAAVAPEQPGPLALGPEGVLYIADDRLNEVLARLPDGNFQVVAGTGTAGFSGDGGPAVRAELDRPSGLAVSDDGTLYIADTGNDRVRALQPDGTITTVAGDGQSPAAPPWTPTMGAPATQTAIGPTYSVAAGADGTLYIATGNAVLGLAPEGALRIVTDGASFTGFPDPFPLGGGCSPESLAVDGLGNLYIGCSQPYALVVRSSDGALKDLGLDRPHDAFAALAGVPGGGVLATDGAGVDQYGATGQQTATVNYLTYRLPNGKPFWPQGIAASSDGTLFLAQDGVAGIGPPAIVEWSPDGTTTVLWSLSNTPAELNGP
jgi:glucose/arabinose dehydrogenase